MNIIIYLQIGLGRENFFSSFIHKWAPPLLLTNNEVAYEHLSPLMRRPIFPSTTALLEKHVDF